MQKEELFFESRDGGSKIHAVRYLPDDGQVKAVLQIVHGMAEHVERYEEFAEFMTGKGFMVSANDHLGHGGSANKEGIDGYFCEQDPATVVVRDVHRLKKMNQQLYPGVPYVFLGHSMGSFILRNYLCRYGTGIQAAVIMGTGNQPKPLLVVSKCLAGMQKAFCGDTHIAKMIDGIAFGSYNKRIPGARTPVDWLTKEEAVVDRYIADPKCGFTFTVNGFRTLFELIWRLQDRKNLCQVPENLPLFMVSGAEDPVGDYGKGVVAAKEKLTAAGVKNIELKLYPGDRHEILNETDRAQVMEDIYNWFVKTLPQLAE